MPNRRWNSTTAMCDWGCGALSDRRAWLQSSFREFPTFSWVSLLPSLYPGEDRQQRCHHHALSLQQNWTHCGSNNATRYQQWGGNWQVRTSEESLARGEPLQRSANIENPNKNDDEELQSDELQGVPDWLQEFKHGLVDESFQNIETLPVLLMSNLWSREPKWYRVNNFFTHFPKDWNFDICLRTKITMASCRRRTGTVVPTAKIFGDLINADHKVLSEGCESRHNHRYAIVVQDLATQWVQSFLPMWDENFSGNTKELAKVLGAHEKTKSHSHWQVLGIWQSLWRSFRESLYVSASQIGNEWDCWESSAQSERRYVCSIVAIRSGWEMVGRFNGMLQLLRNIQDLLSDWKTPCESRFGIPFWRPSHPVWFIGRISPYFCERPIETASIRFWSLPRYIPWVCVVRRGNLERRHNGPQTFEELEEMDASELYAGRPNAKGSVNANERWKFHLPSRRWDSQKFLEKIRDLRTSTSIRDSPDRGEEQDNLWGESDGSSSTSRQDSSWYDGEAKNDFCSFTGDFIHRRHVKPRVRLYVPTEESSPISLKYFDVARTTDTTLDVMSEEQAHCRLLERWWR